VSGGGPSHSLGRDDILLIDVRRGVQWIRDRRRSCATFTICRFVCPMANSAPLVGKIATFFLKAFREPVVWRRRESPATIYREAGLDYRSEDSKAADESIQQLGLGPWRTSARRLHRATGLEDGGGGVEQKGRPRRAAVSARRSLPTGRALVFALLFCDCLWSF